MNAAARALLLALDRVQGRAGFASVGSSPFFFPDLTVKGIGEIAFPLSKQQASTFTRMAELAPYGKGAKTKHDESVRKCWQLDAKHFSFKGKAWNRYLKDTLEKVSADLGISGKISAKPYKLLLYGPGGHFKAHRDTEKLDAMFGTLIVALPSRHEGGQLRIRHGGKQVIVDFSTETHRDDFQHAAFFADCEHEVVPVKSGYRFCVVFNLVLENGDPAPLNLKAEDHAERLAALLEKAVHEQAADNPTVILLQHQYTEANFSLRNLKGNDRHRAAALFASAGKVGLTARLALATLYQMGELESEDDWRHGSWGYADADEGTMGEVYEESLELSHWRDATDRKVSMGSFPVTLDELITTVNFSKIDPDEKAGEGYTGNAGCTMEYWYRRAAVVLWPEGCDEAIRCAKNMPDACETLLAMSAGKMTGPGSPFDKLAKTAIRVMSSQEEPRYHPHRNLDTDARKPVTRLALALAQAKRTDLIEGIARSLTPLHLAVCPAAVWRKLFSICPAETFVTAFSHWLKSPEDFREPLFAVLDGLCAKQSKDDWVAKIAAALVRLEPTKVPEWDARNSRDPKPAGNLDESRILLTASRRLTQKADIAAAITFLKSDASLFAVRKMIGPLFIDKISKNLLEESAVAMELLKFCKVSLAKEISRPLLPYPDWLRPCPPVAKEKSTLHYGRKEPQRSVLEELAAFMADPAAKQLAIRRREAQRVVAEEFIRMHFLDLDCKTIRQGTPHTLLCTKNDRSHRHELEWRRKDVALLKMLDQW
jgi:hypothetical protein